MFETKFRAWDKRNEEMVPHIHSILFEQNQLRISLTSRNEIYNSQEWSVLWKNDFILMQYIGRKDKYGKEIYEGDVVIERCYRDYDCKELNSESTTVIEDIRDIGFGILNEDYENSYDLEIIGNIYKNPELLKNE